MVKVVTLTHWYVCNEIIKAMTSGMLIDFIYIRLPLSTSSTLASLIFVLIN